MFTTVCRRFAGQRKIVLLGILLAVPGYGQDRPQTAVPSKVSGQVQTPAATADTNATQAPLVLTLQDALARAKANDPQFRAALTELGLAHQDTVQSRAQLLPNVNYNMQFIYTQGNGSSTGRCTGQQRRPRVHRAGERSPGAFAGHVSGLSTG